MLSYAPILLNMLILLPGVFTIIPSLYFLWYIFFYCYAHHTVLSFIYSGLSFLPDRELLEYRL